MPRFLYWILQWTWGFVQTFAGAAIALALRKAPRAWYQGAYVSYWRGRAGLSLGMFLFLPENIRKSPRQNERLVKHEFGHTYQSLMLGPFYLLTVGVCSLSWNLFFSRRSKRDYYDFWTERWADRLGKVTIRK